jgi:hypothetical protein
MKKYIGVRWEITVDGKPRTYRNLGDVAIETAYYLKAKNPNVQITIRNLETGEKTVVKLPPNYVG